MKKLSSWFAMGMLIVFSHEISTRSAAHRRNQTRNHSTKRSPRVRRLQVPSGGTDNRVDLSHLVWRLDPEQGKPRCEHGCNLLNKYKPSLGQLSIILDNEA